MFYIGIDPGVNGGAALLDHDGNHVDCLKFAKMTDHDIANALREWQEMGEVKAILEKSQPMRKGGRKQGVASSWKTGDGYGFLRGVLTALQMSFEIVRPLKWQTELNCKTGGDKNITKAKAQRCWPGVKMTHAIADAMLIAVYCKYQNKD